MMNHPYINYALALVMHKSGKVSLEDINHQDLSSIIDIYLSRVSLKWGTIVKGKVKFDYSSDFASYGKSKFIQEDMSIQSPHVISDDVQGIAKRINELRECLGNSNSLNQKADISKSLLAISGEYVRFSNKAANKANASLSLLERSLIAIMTLTDEKPCMTIIRKEEKGFSYNNACIVPALSLASMMDFIVVFNRLRISETEELLISRVWLDGAKSKCYPPQIYNGNFPNAVKTPYLSALSLLGSIGYLAKKGDVDTKALNVLTNLENCPIYIFFQSGNTEILNYNHYIIELAREGNLKSIIDSLYYIKLFKNHDRDNDDIDYQRLDYYMSRFLILFNESAFNNFISCRAEYPNSIYDLFTKYFYKMNGVDREIIESARIIGSWINSVAFKVAKDELDKSKNWNEFSESEKENTIRTKYKLLIELENSVFSAKEGDSMLRHLFTRIGRLANEDAPLEATVFMNAVLEGRIPLEVAKNMLIAYSRVRNEKKKDDRQQIEEIEADKFEDNSNL